MCWKAFPKSGVRNIVFCAFLHIVPDPSCLRFLRLYCYWQGGIYELFKYLLSRVRMALSTHSDNLYKGKGIIWTSRSNYLNNRFATSKLPVPDIQTLILSISPSFFS